MLIAALVVLLLWLLGFSFHVAGGFIHLLLIIGVIMLIVHLLNRRHAPMV
ncbi:MAG TPA: lmo0937 family membrane protein [Candidatus Saccharimonadales bacterium]|nr:lmo0937 family membrane protein [Candidatus Saccharimonadales bacterium]